MSIFNLFKNQLSSVIEWKGQDEHTIWYKHPSERNEIINASKLILSPGQGCILVYEGRIRDILLAEGIYNLKTDNHPFTTTLANIRQNFNSEHKLYIYFFDTTVNYNQNWGTSSGIKYMDPVYQIPVSLGINGTFSFQIENPELLYTQLISNKDVVYTEDIQEIINNDIPEEITNIIANATYSYIQIDANLKNISQQIKLDTEEVFKKIGLALIDFKILGTQFDQNTIRRINEIADMTTQQKAAEQAGLSYIELEKLRALRDAAKNEGGISGIGAQLGVGLEIGKEFLTQKENTKNNNIESTEDFALKLKQLNILLQEGIINQAEFESLKSQILSKL